MPKKGADVAAKRGVAKCATAAAKDEGDDDVRATDDVPAETSSLKGKSKAAKRSKTEMQGEEVQSPKKKKVEGKGDDDDKGKSKAAPAEKTVFAKSELKTIDPPASKRLFKIVSWNVTTIRSLVNKNPTLLTDLFKQQDPDVVFFQETKLNKEDEAEFEEKIQKLVPPGYSLHWNSCSLPGSKSYSGTLAMVRGSGGRTAAANAAHKPTAKKEKPQSNLKDFFGAKDKGQKDLGQDEKDLSNAAEVAPEDKKAGGSGGDDVVKVTMDMATLVAADGDTAVEANQEGRTITCETPHLFIVATYVPNSGDKLQRLKFRTDVWDKRLQQHLKNLEASGKPVVWCGDLNVCHLDADIWNVGAKHLDKSAGTTKEERASFSSALAQGEFVDCFRHVHGNATGWFSYWSLRARNLAWNRGLRLDYFVASEGMVKEGEGPKVVDSQILSEFVALDHAAISLTIAL